MKRLYKFMISSVLASGLLLNTFNVFAESERDSKWIYDRQGNLIDTTGGSPYLRNSFSFGDTGVEVFNADGISLGKINLKREDIYAGAKHLSLDFPEETSTETIIKAPIVPVYQEPQTETTTEEITTIREDNSSNQKIIKVTIGSKTGNVNGENVAMDVAPYIQKVTDKTMIPLRFVATALGIEDKNIIFNQGSKAVTIVINDKNITFLPYETEIKNSRTFVPFRMLGEYLDLDVEWESSTKTAIMKGNIVSNQLKEENTSNAELTEQDIRAMEEEVVRLVNKERAKYGLQLLEISEKLMKTARAKSEDMIINNYYSHTAPNGYNMAKDLNIAENLNTGLATEENIIHIFNSWLNSQGHKENILNPNYRYIGVGIGVDEYGGGVWTQHFSY